MPCAVHGVSERRACRILSVARASMRYRSRRTGDTEQELIEMGAVWNGSCWVDPVMVGNRVPYRYPGRYLAVAPTTWATLTGNRCRPSVTSSLALSLISAL
jgi:hypothetical protein